MFPLSPIATLTALAVKFYDIQITGDYMSRWVVLKSRVGAVTSQRVLKVLFYVNILQCFFVVDPELESLSDWVRTIRSLVQGRIHKLKNCVNSRPKSVFKDQEAVKRNDPDLVQAFLKKWSVESDFKAPNLPLSLRFKGSGGHYNSI
jgi:hypothetical protein